MATARPRKRIKPTPISEFLSAAESARQVDAVSEQSMPSTNQRSAPLDSKVVSVCDGSLICLDKGKSPEAELWRKTVQDSPLSQFAVGPGIVVVSAAKSLSILHISSGSLLVKLLRYESRPLHLKLMSDRYICFLLGNGTIFLWRFEWKGEDLVCKTVVNTSVPPACKPDQIRSLSLSPYNDLEIVLVGGHRFIYKEEVPAWTYLGVLNRNAETDDFNGASHEWYMGAHTEKAYIAESNFMAALVRGDPDEVKERLATFTCSCNNAGEGSKLRTLCLRLLGRRPSNCWLLQSLIALKLDGDRLVREIVLPELLDTTGGGTYWEDISSLIQVERDSGVGDIF